MNQYRSERGVGCPASSLSWTCLRIPVAPQGGVLRGIPRREGVPLRESRETTKLRDSSPPPPHHGLGLSLEVPDMDARRFTYWLSIEPTQLASFNHKHTPEENRSLNGGSIYLTFSDRSSSAGHLLWLVVYGSPQDMCFKNSNYHNYCFVLRKRLLRGSVFNTIPRPANVEAIWLEVRTLNSDVDRPSFSWSQVQLHPHINCHPVNAIHRCYYDLKNPRFERNLRKC